MTRVTTVITFAADAVVGIVGTLFSASFLRKVAGIEPADRIAEFAAPTPIVCNR